MIIALALSVGEVLAVSSHSLRPAWAASAFVAFFAAAAALVKPLRDVVTAAWAGSLGREIARRDRETSLIVQVTGGRHAFALVREMAAQRGLLGIHQAIALPPGADGLLSPELPLYIPRDIHPTLTTWITAHASSGGFLVVSGPAAAGKTRCLFEALAATVGEWPMFLPEDAEQLAAYVETSKQDLPLVVWLNELYDFFGPNGLKASTVRRMLAAPRPILIVGTLWPERYSALVSPSRRESSLDISRDAHEILTMLAHREHLAAEFTVSEHARAQLLAQRDPRIAAALSYPSDALAGNLAAAPALLAMWRDPDDPYSHAVIAAAVAARRCGHPPLIPAAVLEPVALHHLSGRQRAAVQVDWFAGAVKTACTPLPEVRVAALHPAGTAPGVVEGYEVSDILVQHDTAPIDESIWRAVIHHASPEACLDIGVTAQRSARTLEVADLAITKATKMDRADLACLAVVYMGLLAAKRGDVEGARAAYQLAVDSEDDEAAPLAAVNLGLLLDGQGDVDGARAAYQLAIDSRHREAAPLAALDLGILLAAQGDTEHARAAYQLALDSGDDEAAPRAAVNLGVLHKQRGELERARAAYQLALDSNDGEAAPLAARGLGNLLAEQGDVEGARAAYQSAIASGHKAAAPLAAWSLGNLLAEQGDAEGARRAYQFAIDSGHEWGAPMAALNLGILLAEQGDVEGARAAYQLAIDSGHEEAASRAAVNLGVSYKQEGDLERADAMYRLAIASADHQARARATLNLGSVLKRQGNVDGARAAYQLAIDSADEEISLQAAMLLGVLMAEHGDAERARAAYQLATESGLTWAAPRAALNLAVLLAGRGDADGAVKAYQLATEAREVGAAPRAALKLGALLAVHGDLRGARAACRVAMKIGDEETALLARRRLQQLEGDDDSSSASGSREWLTG